MSNALAIASVTAVLKGILQNATTDIQHNINMKVSQVVNVTAVSPSRIAKPDSEEVPQLNLFLYQIAPQSSTAQPRPAIKEPARRKPDQSAPLL